MVSVGSLVFPLDVKFTPRHHTHSHMKCMGSRDIDKTTLWMRELTQASKRTWATTPESDHETCHPWFIISVITTASSTDAMSLWVMRLLA